MKDVFRPQPLHAGPCALRMSAFIDFRVIIRDAGAAGQFFVKEDTFFSPGSVKGRSIGTI